MPPKANEERNADQVITAERTAAELQILRPPGQSTALITSIFPFTFCQIIEADHASISHLAGLVIRPNTTITARLSHLTTLLWRLIRHDISEELVMRRAFERHLGGEGAMFATRDRDDHMEVKEELLALYKDIDSKPESAIRVDELVKQVKTLAAEMTDHMNQESGVWLPMFEACVGETVSIELGREYAATLVLTPEIQLPVVTGDVDYDELSPNTSRCFSSILHYAVADIDKFREILERLEKRAQNSHDHGYFAKRMKEELAVLKLVTSSNNHAELPISYKATDHSEKGKL